MKNRFVQKSVYYIFVSVLLVLVYPLDLHFPTGNQCIYFFWGIKNTGFGFLSNDFLATQPDPFPLFSILVKYSSQFFGNNIFLLWYWFINLVYVVAFFEIIDEIRKQVGWQTPSLVGRVGEGCLFLFLNSTLIWGFFFSHFFNFDLRWAWDSGFADQGILRGYFQPSCFGVFILLSFMFFIKRKYFPAFVSAALAACFHANYLLISGIFIGVYALFLVRDKNHKTAIIGSVISLLIVLPYLVYVYSNFGSSSSETIEYLKSHIEGHIHFDYHVWMNAKAFLQFLLIMLSLWIIRKTVLFFPIMISLIILTVFTLLTYLSGSIFLLNLTPWRISVVIVPVAVAVVVLFLSSLKNNFFYSLFYSLILSMLFSAIFFRVFGNNTYEYILKWRVFTFIFFCLLFLILFLSQRYFILFKLNLYLPVLIIFLTIILGLSGILFHKPDGKSKDELIAYAKEHLLENQQYIVPTAMIEFRLTTGAPVFVDSTIFLSNALPEWDKRLTFVNRFYSDNSEKNISLLDSLSENCGITHIIATREMDFISQKELFRNDRYIIFELNNNKVEQ